MHVGKVKEWGERDSFKTGNAGDTENSQLGELVLDWLKKDQGERGPRNV